MLSYDSESVLCESCKIVVDKSDHGILAQIVVVGCMDNIVVEFCRLSYSFFLRLDAECADEKLWLMCDNAFKYYSRNLTYET